MGVAVGFFLDVSLLSNEPANLTELTFLYIAASKSFLNVFFAALRPRLIRVKREVGCPALVRRLNYVPLRLIGRLSGI